jgi:hypothetical protein
MPKIINIGDSTSDRLYGGETWTVVYVKPDAHIGLANPQNNVPAQRLRLEDRLGWRNAWLYPDDSTKLYTDGNKKIRLDAVRVDDVQGFTYEFEVKLDGVTKKLWLQEGSTDPVAEAEIHETDPTNGGPIGGGSGGIRR